MESEEKYKTVEKQSRIIKEESKSIYAFLYILAFAPFREINKGVGTKERVRDNEVS